MRDMSESVISDEVTTASNAV